MIKYSAKIIHVCPHIEEEVTLKVNNLEITCFASVCSYPIVIGEEYPVTFNFSDFELSEQHHTRETCLTRIGNTYRYELKGILNNGTIDSGIKIRDVSRAE